MVGKEDKRRTVVGKEDKYTSSLGLRKNEDTELKRRTVLLKGGRLATLLLGASFTVAVIRLFATQRKPIYHNH